MSNLHEIILECKCDGLTCVIAHDDVKYMCYSRLNNSKNLAVAVSDGIDVWLAEYTYEELQVQSELLNINMEAYFNKLRRCFKDSDIDVSMVGMKVMLTLGTGSSAISLDLFEAKAVQKKTELQSILFRLAERTLDLEKQLERAAQGDVNAASSTNSGPSADQGKGAAKVAPKQTGMSVLNPGSKKRKSARGVRYD